MATTQRYDVKDLELAAEGVRRIAWADRQMPVLAAIRERFEREQPLAGHRISCLPARDDRDGEPRPHALRGRRRRRPLRVEPALHAGRRRGRARRRVRGRRVRDQGRGQRHLLPPHRGRRRPPAASDHGRRGRRHRRAPFGPSRAARRRHRRHRGDDDRRHPPEGARARREARIPGDRRQRGAHEASLRQPLRHRPVDHRRDRACDERPARRQALRRRRLRLDGTWRRDACPWNGLARHRHRGRPAARARGRDGRLRGAADGARGSDRRHLLHGDRRQERDHPVAHGDDEGRRDPLATRGTSTSRSKSARSATSRSRHGRPGRSSTSSRSRTAGVSTSSARAGSSTSPPPRVIRHS